MIDGGDTTTARGRRGQLAAVAVAAAVALGLWLSAVAPGYFRTRGLRIEDGAIRGFGPRIDLLVPVPLYPSARIDRYTLQPAGAGDRTAIYVEMATDDPPQSVIDHYSSKLRPYGIHSLQAAKATDPTQLRAFVTRKPEAAVLLVAETSAGRTRSPHDPWPPPTATSRETKFSFFVPVQVRSHSRP